nr:multicopper oxidase domain-containing protein [Kibdelosporangium phytohabitans]
MYAPGEIIATPRLGAVEKWRLSSDFHHPVHLHLAHFQVISRGGGLRARDAGWKDTVDIRPTRPSRCSPGSRVIGGVT